MKASREFLMDARLVTKRQNQIDFASPEDALNLSHTPDPSSRVVFFVPSAARFGNDLALPSFVTTNQ
jgi:hypothetical protein